jgi:hypothetical protein
VTQKIGKREENASLKENKAQRKDERTSQEVFFVASKEQLF